MIYYKGQLLSTPTPPNMQPQVRLLLTTMVSCLMPGVRAHEGMWLPTLLQAIEGNMHTEGMLINAEDIYSLNNGSLKDATALFGGGCTAEVISA